MPMASTPVAMPSAAKHAPIASWGVPYDWLIKEEKLVYYVSASHAGTTHK